MQSATFRKWLAEHGRSMSTSMQHFTVLKAKLGARASLRTRPREFWCFPLLLRRGLDLGANMATDF
jgi:hypothetical protein